MGFLDTSVVAISIPQIRTSLDASFAEVQWISNSYMLFLSALILIGGAAGDRYGLRRTFAAGISIFVVTSIFCAIAWSPESLIFFRALKGIGAAIMIPGSMAIIAKNYPREERGKALGLWVTFSAMTTAFGPLFGGILLASGNDEVWRLIFAINLPLGLISLAILKMRVPEDAPKTRLPLDLTGAILLTAAMGSVALGLTLIGEANKGLGLGAILTGLIVGFAALVWESRVRHPMIDLGLFSSRVFSGVNFITFLVWSGMGALFFFLPMVIVTAWQMPEHFAGGIFLPFSLLIAVMSSPAGKWADRRGPRLPLTLGAFLAGLGYLGMGLAVLDQNYWFGVIPAIFIIGIAMGLCASPLSAAVMLAVEDDKTGSASGINNMVARMASLFAVAGLGAVVTTLYSHFISSGQLPADIADLVAGAGFGERLTGGLYQINIIELQRISMNRAMAALCSIIALCCFAGSLTAWLTQVDKSGALKD